jgi:radical SAM family RiPP maturation amino acid epimerase
MTPTASPPPAHEVKRLVEICSSGLYSPEELLSNPGAGEIARRHHARLHPEVIRVLLEGRPWSSEEVMAACERHNAQKLAWRDLIRKEAAPSEPALREWRERQVKRCFLELGESRNAAIAHIPAAFELADGCSVACWFCALNAPPLSAVYRYTPENAELWRGIQLEMREVLGPAARWSSAYWATEPLDNRDQEAFCDDFYRIHGIYPQTTTAVPLRDVERTRALLADSFAKGCRVNRFSVHSGGQLLRIHENFSSEELLNTELLLENPEAPMFMVRSGRLHGIEKTDPELSRREDARAGGSSPRIDLPGTTACVSGFLVRMIPKTVELISPCAADARWPCGYIVFDRRSFTSARDFGLALREMIRDNMPTRVEPEHRVALTSRVDFTPAENGFVLSTVFGKISYGLKSRDSFLSHLGGLLHQGGLRAGEIAIECYYTFGAEERVTLGFINDIFQRGLLRTSAERSRADVFGKGS